MKLSIINGTWNLQSLDGYVLVTVLPRRALGAAATEVSLRAEPMPALAIRPEEILDGPPAQAWVWDGSTDAAHRIIPDVMKAVRMRLTRSTPDGERVRRWREQVLESLFPGAAAAAALTRQA